MNNAILATPGTATWTIPAGVTSVIAELFGAGGGGGSTTNIGGDGAYLRMALTALTPGNTIAYTVGAGGAAGNPGVAGGATIFGGISCAGGGAGSNGAAGTNADIVQVPGAGVIEQRNPFFAGGDHRVFVRGGAINAVGENGMIVIRW